MANDKVNQYVYDGEGRLCAVYGPGGMVGYLYDSGGNRVAKGTITSMTCDPTANGFLQTAGYVVGPSGEQLTEVDANNQWTHTNVYADGRLIATYDNGGTAGAQVVHNTSTTRWAPGGHRCSSVSIPATLLYQHILHNQKHLLRVLSWPFSYAPARKLEVGKEGR